MPLDVFRRFSAYSDVFYAFLGVSPSELCARASASAAAGAFFPVKKGAPGFLGVI